MGATTNYVGSYGDGFNGLVTDPYGGANARVNYGAGGCTDNAAFTATGACPSPTRDFGGGRNHRGFFSFTYDNSVFAPPVRMSHVRDGLSTTIILGHTATQCTSSLHMWVSNAGSVAGTSLPINYRGCPSSGVALAWTDTRGFHSFHVGGTVSCMADGSVRSISQKISSFTHNALGSRDGREAIGEY